MNKHFIDIIDHSAEWLQHVLNVGHQLLDNQNNGRANEPILAGQTLSILLEKPSLRTRVSFERAMTELGGVSSVVAGDEIGIGQ